MNSIYIFLALNLEMETFYKELRPNLFTRCRWDCCRYLLNTNNTDTFWLPNSLGTNAFKHLKNTNTGESEFNKEDSPPVLSSHSYQSLNVIKIGEGIAKNESLILNALTTRFPSESDLEYYFNKSYFIPGLIL